MEFLLRLETVGLCLVLEATGKDDYHRLVAVQHPKYKHEAFFAFDSVNLRSATNVDLQTQNTQRLVALPPCSTVKVANPKWSSTLPSPKPYEPVTYEDLGLGCVVQGLGQEDWLCGEEGLALLPKLNAYSAWSIDLGEWAFPATGRTGHVADSFLWGGHFDDEVRIDFKMPQGKQGSVTLGPDPNFPGQHVKVSYSCIVWPEKPGNAFGHSGTAFQSVSTVKWDPENAPSRQGQEVGVKVEHIRSQSCPPIKP